MFSALFSFLGGSVFRAIWGEAANMLTASQDHKYELEAMKAQADLDDKAHQREMERLRVSAELGIKQIEVQAEGKLADKDADAFIAAMATINVKTGVEWVDAWNGCVRPACATVAILLWVSWIISSGFKPTEWDKELVGVILGFYFASRVLHSRGK